MTDAGGRRIKRSLFISVMSVKFCNQEMLDRFSKFQLLGPYIQSRSEEIAQYNKDRNADKTFPLNGRHLTNLGLFRKYMELYLKQNENIHQDMTTMIQQLAPSQTGIPLEVYCFTKTIEWIPYENIQSDIFDHILATARLFELDVFQGTIRFRFH